MVLYLKNAASDLGASRKHYLSVYLDGPGDAGHERIAPVVLVASEGLTDGCRDRCAFRQGDELKWLRCTGDARSIRSYDAWLVRAARQGKEAENRDRKR